MTKPRPLRTTDTTLPPPERVRDAILDLARQGGPILREVISSTFEGRPITIGKPPLSSEHERDLAKTIRGMKRASLSPQQVREFLHLYVRDCPTRPRRVADSPYEEETWFAQNARLIDACIALYFPDRRRAPKKSGGRRPPPSAK
jgi:hypothetical protein